MPGYTGIEEMSVLAQILLRGALGIYSPVNKTLTAEAPSPIPGGVSDPAPA